MKIVIRDINTKLFYLGYSCILVAFLLSVSTIPNKYQEVYALIRWLRITGFFFLFVKILFSKYEMNSFLGVAFFVVFILLTAYTTQLDIFLINIVILLACGEIKLRHIIKCDLIVRTFLTFMIVVMCLMGNIEDILDYRNGMLSRHSWGFSHPNRFALNMLIICVYFFYLNQLKIKLKHILLFVFSGILTLAVSDGRTSFLGIACVVVLALVIYRVGENNFTNMLSGRIRTIGVGVVLMCMVISYVIPVILIINGIPTQISSTVISRFVNCAKGLINYGINMWGQHIVFVGARMSRILKVESNGIDNMYVYLGINFGIVMLVCVVALFICAIFNSIKKGDYVGSVCLMLFLILGIMENQFLRIESNIFLIFGAQRWFVTKKPNVENYNIMIENEALYAKECEGDM